MVMLRFGSSMDIVRSELGWRKGGNQKPPLRFQGGVRTLTLVILGPYPWRIQPMTKKKKRKARRADNHRSAIIGFYRTHEWKVVRYEALKRDGATCQCCGRSARDGFVMNVDHIKPIRKYPKLALELSNLQTLCASCNQGKGGWDRTDWRDGGPNDYLTREFREIMG